MNTTLSKRIRELARWASAPGAVLAGSFLVAGCRVPDAGREAAAGFGYRPLVQPAQELTLERGESLPAFLERGGLSAPEIRRLLDRIRGFADWTNPGSAVSARFHRWPGEPPERVELKIDRDRTLDFTLRGAVWQLAVDSVSVTHDTVVVSGLLDGGLYSARLGGQDDRLSIGEKAELARHLAEVYAWQIDFFRDPEPGDRFRMAIERAIRPDGSLRITNVLAAEYASGARLLEAYRFSPSDGLSGAAAGEGGRTLFYDASGVALRGAFLRAPLDLVRVTSRFSNSRYHPVLRGYRSHAGVDYGAPSGTPVRVTGEGRISHAGWAGDFGLMIEVDHAAGVRTRYAHLSGITDDLHVGKSVVQGEIIGAVGSTGLSTGPHLHYEFRINGRAVDPSSVEVPVTRPLAAEDVARFDEERGAARALLGRARWPGGLLGSGVPGR